MNEGKDTCTRQSQAVDAYHAAALLLDEYAGRAYAQHDDEDAQRLRRSAQAMRDNAQHCASD